MNGKEDVGSDIPANPKKVSLVVVNPGDGGEQDRLLTKVTGGEQDPS